jgi:hypothetical protein
MLAVSVAFVAVAADARAMWQTGCFDVEAGRLQLQPADWLLQLQS